MGIHDWSDDIKLVRLSRNQQEEGELQSIIEMLREQGDCSVVLDFSGVEFVGCALFTQLLELRQLWQGGSHKLVLSGLSLSARSVFETVRLHEVFDLVDNTRLALDHIQTG